MPGKLPLHRETEAGEQPLHFTYILPFRTHLISKKQHAPFYVLLLSEEPTNHHLCGLIVAIGILPTQKSCKRHGNDRNPIRGLCRFRFLFDIISDDPCNAGGNDPYALRVIGIHHIGNTIREAVDPTENAIFFPQMRRHERDRLAVFLSPIRHDTEAGPQIHGGSHMRTADRTMKNDNHAGAEGERAVDADQRATARF